MKEYGLILFLFCTCQALAQPADTVRSWHIRHQSALLDEFMQFLSLPNTARDTTGLRQNADFIMGMMRQRGIGQVQLLHAATKGTPPAIYGEVQVPGARHTLVFYAHYDGQPVNPAQWAPGLEPFRPQLFSAALSEGGRPLAFPAAAFEPGWRIYARGASDDKAGVMAILAAYEALQKTGLQPACNLKFFFEGEEEAGSPHLGEILQKHRGLLQSDGWIICDGPVHQSGSKQVVLGVRGDAHLQLTVYGPKRPLHSGHYGNWAPNPVLALARLLASMKDDNGRVTIKDFYSDVKPLTAEERKALRAVPPVEEQLKAELGISGPELKGHSLPEAINLPSLNINGIQGGNVGAQASNQIPTQASAVLDLRLVVGNDWRRQQQKVINHIRRQGFTVVEHEPTDEERRRAAKLVRVTRDSGAYNAQRTAFSEPLVQKVLAAVQSTAAGPVVVQPTMGGSLPLYLFGQHLQARTITVPIANHDNNQHAENENIRLKNLWEGIETMAALMQMRL